MFGVKQFQKGHLWIPEQLQDQFLGETVSEKESIVCSRVLM